MRWCYSPILIHGTPSMFYSVLREVTFMTIAFSWDQ
jgi:hypothetical protein